MTNSNRFAQKENKCNDFEKGWGKLEPILVKFYLCSSFKPKVISLAPGG